MGGLSMKALRINDKQILGQSNFGKNHKEIDGKAIKKKAEETLRRCKKYYGYWKEFLVLDQFPSGKDEDDALKHVISREFNDNKIHTGEIESEDEEEDDDNDSSDSDDNTDTAVTTVKTSSSSIVEAPPEKYLPLDFLTFMLMGPWGKAKHNLDVCPLIAGDARDYDGVKDGSRKGMRKEETKVHDLTRDALPGRGNCSLPSSHTVTSLPHTLSPVSLTHCNLPSSYTVTCLPHTLSPVSLTHCHLPSSHTVTSLPHTLSPFSLTHCHLSPSYTVTSLPHTLSPFSLTHCHLPSSHTVTSLPHTLSPVSLMHCLQDFQVYKRRS
jgi:hypothetical protein